MKIIKSTIAALLCTALICTAASCGNTENKNSKDKGSVSSVSGSSSENKDASASDGDSSEDKSSDSDPTGGNYEACESMKEAAANYDPDGDERLYDIMRETYEGDYFIELLAGDVNMSFAIKDGTMAARTVNQGMASRAYYTEDKSFYDISDATTTYTLYENYEYDIRNSDSLFGATSNFRTAETDENGNFAETYAIDKDMVGTGGTIRYTFNSETGALMSYEITIAGSSMIYEVNKLRTTEPSDLELPDLTDYNRQEGAN